MAPIFCLKKKEVEARLRLNPIFSIPACFDPGQGAHIRETEY